jgi:DNA repair ATPase RecN
MADREWVEKALLDFQKNELTEIERVKKAYEAFEAAKKELSDAKESLKGIRGCIAEMTWQLDYFNKNGKLP